MPIVIDYTVDIITPVALAFSGLAVYVSFKNRANALREKIYDKQVDVFHELSRRVVEIEELLHEYSAEAKFPETNEKVDYYANEILKQSDQLDVFLSSSEIFIPEENYNTFSDFIKYLIQLNKQIIQSPIKEIDVRALSDEIFKVQEEIRDILGLEKLHKENRRLTQSSAFSQLKNKP